MPISRTIRFFVIVSPSGCDRVQQYQGGSDGTTIFAHHADFEVGASRLDLYVADTMSHPRPPFAWRFPATQPVN
jgi:hypothetical protein